VVTETVAATVTGNAKMTVIMTITYLATG
jgi:hypothetical protein